MKTTIDRFGRVVLPKSLRDAFDLKPGTTIEIEATEKEILLKPEAVGPFLEDCSGVLVFTGTPIGDLDQIVRMQREARLQSIAGKVRS